MDYLMVETDSGDRLDVLHPNGHVGGKALSVFILMLDIYCSPRGDERGWFSILEAHASEPLCQLVAPLLNSYYFGEEWGQFGEDEYALFRLRFSEDPTTEDSFRRTIQAVQAKWVDAPLLLRNLIELQRLIMEGEPEPLWFYQPEDTHPDLQALIDTVSLAIQRHAAQVRLLFF